MVHVIIVADMLQCFKFSKKLNTCHIRSFSNIYLTALSTETVFLSCVTLNWHLLLFHYTTVGSLIKLIALTRLLELTTNIAHFFVATMAIFPSLLSDYCGFRQNVFVVKLLISSHIYWSPLGPLDAHLFR